tara:strand:+ start:212 stop:382 length:171 start_codon:yes stop_codon:yes gene_type:complete
MAQQEINPQDFIVAVIEQRNDALNKLASYMAVNVELEKKIKEIQDSDKTSDKQDIE